MHVSCIFGYIAISHSCFSIFLYCRPISRAIARFSFFSLYGRVSVTQICNVLANAHSRVSVEPRFTFSALVPANVPVPREEIGRKCARNRQHRRGHKSRTIPRENGFQWAARIDGWSAGSPVGEMDVGTNEKRCQWQKGVSCSSSVNKRCPLVSRWLDPFRNFNFRLAGDSLRRSPVKDASGSIRSGRIVSADRHWRRCDHPLRKKTTDIRCPDLVPVRKWRGEGWRAFCPAARLLKAISVEWDSWWNKRAHQRPSHHDPSKTIFSQTKNTFLFHAEK